MGRIGDFVGIDSDEAAPNPDLTPVKRFRLPAWPVARKDLAQDRGREFHKGEAAASLHLEQQGLALMDRHAARCTYRLQSPARRQVALVKRVPGLVQNPHQRLGKIALVIARRDAHVVGRAAAKRMGADVEPAMVKIKADRLHQPHCRLPLCRYRKRSGWIA